MNDSYKDLPQAVLPLEKTYSDIEREINLELEEKTATEIVDEIEGAVIGAFDNIMLLTSLTFDLGTDIVNKELKAIEKKYKL